MQALLTVMEAFMTQWIRVNLAMLGPTRRIFAQMMPERTQRMMGSTMGVDGGAPPTGVRMLKPGAQHINPADCDHPQASMNNYGNQYSR